ncbi:hypothetical protein HGH93_09675 [Chitinophaga polysaccharea]|uniref:hypothetical protein n=1 Tax=Chitinophaga polysaccharea TaxID=1293035 RepID=UPI0014556B34|nr:hypothetical protein [Chitinophaga polysaccharea]NLR58367.1 hypothetical protein [Chitinophaga polysaccharea]
MQTNYSIPAFILVLLIVSCNFRTQHTDINQLIQKYSEHPEDSARLEAAVFLREQLEQQTSERNIIYSVANNQTVQVNLDSVNLPAFLTENGLAVRTEIIQDEDILSADLLMAQIDSYDFYLKKWKWNRKADKYTLHNYLLAYKIHKEEPQRWREYFFREEGRLLKEVLAANKFEGQRNTDNPAAITAKVLDMASKWYNFEDQSFNRYGSMSFAMMKCVRKGNCYFGAYTGIYMLRSFGIPAALDYVPYWGSRNGGHAEIAALDSTGVISPIPGHALGLAAKVFRISFIPTTIWKDSIRPFMGTDSFLLGSIAHDHWLDVTSIHTQTADIDYLLPQKTTKRIAYICAFNYGEWTPVYWGRIQRSTLVHVKQMGKNILYRMALPDGNSFQLVGQPFLLDSAGQQTQLVANDQQLCEMKLSKLNTGSGSWVKKGNAYTLYGIDKAGNWQKLSDILCTRDSILPTVKAPTGGVYRLTEKVGNKRLERPFEYRNSLQVWR